jgi:hypothetical protein
MPIDNSNFLPQEDARAVFFRFADSRARRDDRGSDQYGLEPDAIIGWFSTNHNPADGWLVYDTTDAEKAEFGEYVKRTYSARTESTSLVRFNLETGTYAFIDNEAYTEGEIKFDRATRYRKLIIENTVDASVAFRIV